MITADGHSKSTSMSRQSMGVRISLTLYQVTILSGLVSALIFMGLNLSNENAGIRFPTHGRILAHYASSRLEESMRHSMYEHVSDDKDIETIAQWVARGASESEYESAVKPIMELDCTNCHSAESTMTDAAPGLPLTNFQEVSTHAKKGYSWKKMSNQAHIHLFSIGLVLVSVTLPLALSRFSRKITVAVTLIGFLGLWIDVLGWWLTKFANQFSYLIIIGGASMVAGIASSCILSLMDLWLPHPSNGRLSQERQ